MREVMKETNRDGNQWLTKENVKGISMIYMLQVLVHVSQEPLKFPNKVWGDRMERK